LKKIDLVFVVAILVFFIPFFISEDLYHIYNLLNKEHGMIMSFVKFAILATLGESIGLRIKTGVYNNKGFGLLPRAFVWGFLGLTIKLAFVIFATGVPNFLAYMGVLDAPMAMKGAFTSTKLLVAFTISVSMNVIYAPVMMTLHKITDTHILLTGGTMKGLFKKIPFVKILKELNWEVQWNFVLKKLFLSFGFQHIRLPFCCLRIFKYYLLLF
jgi:hypothetical protein